MSAALFSSRVEATIAALAADGAARARSGFAGRRVLLTGDTGALETMNGLEMARSALQLLMRLGVHIDIALPAGPLVTQLAEDGLQYAWDDQPKLVAGDPSFGVYDAVLSVGATLRPELPWTAITASGWLARVSSGATAIEPDCDRFNPVAALAAASLGVCDVFKRLIDVRPERGQLLDGVTLSLWDHEVGGSAGPDLPPSLDANVMIDGAGAIGSAIVHVMALLPLQGHVTLVDKQSYGEENWGTCLDLERRQVGEAKADVAAARLCDTVTAKPYEMTIKAAAATKLGQEVPWPNILLNGLDGIDARHEAQDVWPDMVIDGALDADLQVRVSAHPWDSGTACLRCLYRHPPGKEDSKVAAARMTGLAIESLDQQDRVPTDRDIALAEPRARTALVNAKQNNQKICSVVNDIQSMSQAQQPKGFSPSVPFAASFSACLVVTEFIRFVTTGAVGVHPLFQLSLLQGPENAQLLPDVRHADCTCTTQRALIERYRASRSTNPEARRAEAAASKLTSRAKDPNRHFT